MTTTKLLLFGALTLAMGSTPAGQTPVPSSTTIQDDPRLAKLPPGLREKGRQILAAADEDTRADLAEALADEHAIDSPSFVTSGHAMGTFIFCGVGCHLLLRRNRSWTRAAVVVTASASWCVVMAFSRVYLGMHDASDVIGGVRRRGPGLRYAYRRSRCFVPHERRNACLNGSRVLSRGWDRQKPCS